MRFQIPKVDDYRTLVAVDLMGKQQSMKEAIMNKIIIALITIYFLGDPYLQYLSLLGDLKIYVGAAALSLASMPWVAELLDG